MSHRLAAAIGMFDGVHRGHRHLLSTVSDAARSRGLLPAAVTFRAHPSLVLTPENTVKQLTTAEERKRLLLDAGMEEVIVLDFDPHLRNMTSAEFIRMLHERYNIDCLIVGFNNRFGCDREHNLDDYVRFGRAEGVEVIGATETPDVKVSSSIVRRLLEKGEVEKAAEALGRCYRLEGKVVGGKRLGRQIGFPTANIEPESGLSLIPASGVYAAFVTDSANPAVRHKAMLNIGRRPTVNTGHDITVEAHLLDFKGDLYGHTLSVEFAARLRDERRYQSLESLAAVLATDAAVTRRVI